MSGATARDGLGPFDPYWSLEVPLPRRGRTWRVRIAIGAATVAAMIGAAALAPSRSPATPGAAPTPPPAATYDPAAAPTFAIDGLDPAHSHSRFETRIAAGGDRQDALSMGSLDGAAAGLRLEIWREGGERAAPSLYVAAAEVAAAAGAAVERMSAIQRFVASQGPLEWAELSLAGRERGCAAFRLAVSASAGLRGVVCAAPGTTVEAAAIACLTEKIELTKAGHEAGVAEWLRSAPRRVACRTPLG